MRKAAIVGAAVVCVCVIFALSGPFAQRVVNGDGTGGGSSAPVPVSVANFPQVQPVQVDKTISVTGSVAVTNFPAVQQVAGTVSVGNLPVDADGNVRVTGGHTTVAVLAHFVGVTTSTFYDGAGTLVMSRACNAEVPSSRVCDWDELFSSIPPPQLAGSVVLSIRMSDSPDGRCITTDGVLRCQASDQPAPAACCGY